MQRKPCYTVMLTRQSIHPILLAQGTPCYAAPEVMLSHQATKTTDVFSFGILMQQMLSRMPPYARAANGGIEVNKLFWKPVSSRPLPAAAASWELPDGR